MLCPLLQALFINSILTILWPKLGPAVYKEAVKQSKQPIEDVKAKASPLSYWVWTLRLGG